MVSMVVQAKKQHNERIVMLASAIHVDKKCRHFKSPHYDMTQIQVLLLSGLKSFDCRENRRILL